MLSYTDLLRKITVKNILQNLRSFVINKTFSYVKLQVKSCTENKTIRLVVETFLFLVYSAGIYHYVTCYISGIALCYKFVSLMTVYLVF